MPLFSGYPEYLQAVLVGDSQNSNVFHQWGGSVLRGGSRSLTYSLSATAPATMALTIQRILNEVASFTNITFERYVDQAELTSIENYPDNPYLVTDSNPDLRLSYQTDGTRIGGGSGFYYWTNNAGEIVDIDAYVQIWSPNAITIIHELGHALGLKHTSPNQDPAQAPFLATQYQNHNYTVMHYTLDGPNGSNTFNISDGEWLYEHFQLLDVYALQQRFGVNAATYAGASTHTAASLGVDQWLQVLWDASGTDTIDMSAQSRSQLIDLRSGGFSNIGSVAGNNPSGFNLAIAIGADMENAAGGSGNDTIVGNGLANILNGGPGNDALFGNGASDQLLGGDGDDILYVDAADAVINGGGGFDKLVFDTSGNLTAVLTAMEAVELVGGANLTLTGMQFANGLTQTMTVSGTGTITVNMDGAGPFISKLISFASSGVSFVVNGTSGNDIFKLGNRNHTINAGDGGDQIKGGSASDTIDGGTGSDKINGAAGADILTGGSGNDVFKYGAAVDSGLGAAADRITDFSIGGDRLNFVKLDANAGTAGDQAFAFVGVGAFLGGGAGSIRYQNSGADLLVQVDVDGNGSTDMEIILQGLNGQTLTAADFVL